MTASRLVQSAFDASSRSFLVSKGMFATVTYGCDAYGGGGLGEVLSDGVILAGMGDILRHSTRLAVYEKSLDDGGRQQRGMESNDQCMGFTYAEQSKHMRY